MGDGTLKPIEDIRLGDQVMAGDPQSRGPPHAARVTGLIRDLAAHLVDISFNTTNGTAATITSTQFHPFWTNNRGWVDARELKTGDVLQNSKRNDLTVTNVTVRQHFGRSYNLEVANVHTYYALADDRTAVLVHNQVVPYQPVPPGNEIVPYFPPNNGFAGETGWDNLVGGDQFQRFGGTGGSYVTTPGTPPYQVSLPPGTSTTPNLYQVQPGYTVPVQTGTAGIAFGQPGGGPQMIFGNGKSIQDLLDAGAISPVSK
jgi:hypothetical protein